jgi:phosphoribosylaminoimidazole-succinocarboxamide synthase
MLPHLYSGKVRDIYDAGDGRLLMVTSDRMSAFDVVMNEPIPSKGRVLTATTAFWLEHLSDVAGSHLISTELADLPEEARLPEWAGRVMLCHRAEMLLVECIVRGYLSGSAWKEYKATGTMHGTKLPSGLQESDRLPEPVFTPSTKAEQGLHDENITFEQAVDIIGLDAATRARDISLELYRRGSERAAERGLTPDSSRFWPADEWKPGITPPSFDKQPLRDYLDGLDWDKTPPPPPLSDEIVQATSERYRDGYERITGRSLDDWPGA